MKRTICALAFLAITPVAIANTSTSGATLTADNHYALFLGDVTGSNLLFVGRNELGSSGSSGTYNWSEPEFFSFTPRAGDYLYVAAWDTGGPQAWIGSFTTPAGTIISNLTDWKYKYVISGGPGGAENNSAPGTGSLQTLINNTTPWASPVASSSNGVGPWGTVSVPSIGARWIWHDTLLDNSTSDQGYALFRSAKVVMVPEPETYALLLAGLGLMGAIARRRKPA